MASFESVFDYPAFDSLSPLAPSSLPLLQRLLLTLLFRGRYSVAGHFESHERVRTSGLRCTNQPSSLLMFTTTYHPTFLPTTTDLLFPLSILVPHPATQVVQMKTITTIFTILGVPVVSDYPSPAIPSSPQPTFDPSPRLTVNVVKDYPYAEVEYCTSSPNLNPKVLCLSMNHNTLFDSLCQMTNRFDKSMNSYQP